ncbi:MAG: carboxypeptidase regulatory-like domain-containing protein [Chitinispirillaceae bacterium]|nr:carboxypeptidase regulatory-like domain-containing protein [Chitinispirillaceae bacterium]
MPRVPEWSVIYIISAFLTVSAQNILLSGVVTNSSQEPVQGAKVTLISHDLTVTTDATGAYSFIKVGNRNVFPILPSHQNIALVKGILTICLTGSSPVVIELFDFRGRLLDRIIRDNTIAGEYHVNIAEQPYGSKMLLLRVNIGSESTVLRYLPFFNGFCGNREVSTSSGAVLAKMQAAVDTIKVVATGYIEKKVGIESYEGVNDISLEKETVANLEKFSFFVTSLEGLRTLSGSDNGFGGDLRFGKTGPGAGLLGADSICACLAEMSMPGSSAKKWSAFLSVLHGIDGNQVNAIDRIGEGPWYDRMGRLVANNKGELLNERPINADEAIINDLPNEYGIPNHRPDPTVAAVDNHMTVTGSNQNGELYTDGSGETEGNTCDDWTSTTVRDRPRVGLSWPRGSFGRTTGGTGKVSMGGMGGHWISAMNAWGCEAGYELIETGAGTPGVYTIGNGGGYGGFYCFAHQP